MAEMQFAEKVEILRGIAQNVEYCAGKLGPMEALAAGLECKKCIATKKGTKGCRTCMGEWFEHIRMRKS